MSLTESEKELVSRYNQSIPRYTSYPTAPHFQNLETEDKDLEQSVYKALGDLSLEKKPASLYLHIPYCAEMCTFCACYTKITRRQEPVDAYVQVLLGEIDLLGKTIGQKMPLSYVHWGGGSPTLLRADHFSQIIEKIHQRFTILPTATLSVEMDPRTVQKDYIKALQKAGITRASIGVQDFHPEVLSLINRSQTYEMTQQTVNWLREAGIKELNLDLLYGLPAQNLERINSMVEKSLSLQPDRIALFGYAHVPWMRPHQTLIPEDRLPDIVERFEQFSLASRKLNAAGFLSIGLDHFARKDNPLYQALKQKTLRRNFQGYSTDSSSILLPLGVSSIGQTEDLYFANTLSTHAHRRSIEAGKLPLQRALQLSETDRRHRRIIMDLMCYLESNPKALWPQEGWQEVYEKLQPLERDGLCLLKADGTIVINEERRPFMRIVAACFDTYLGAKGRHSKAI